MWSDAIGAVLAASIHQGVRLVGRRVAKADAPWLRCPMGNRGQIGAEFYARLAEREGLTLLPAEGRGLLADFTDLAGDGFDPAAIDPRIRDFYECTSQYQLEAWSEAAWHTRVFLWVLTRFVSRRMDQLNFPVSSLELAGGMSSEILPMIDGRGDLVHTGWLRRLQNDGRVIYTGLYSVERVPGHPGACVKVSFPVPQGSATVFLKPQAQADGSLRLISAGRRFGDPGFYRMVVAGPDHWRVRYIRTLREQFHVFVDDRKVLRTTHHVCFLGQTVLRLHYKISCDRP